MPIFEYHCKQCKCEFETFVLSAEDKAMVKCPKCDGQDVEKLMSCFVRTGASNLSSGSICSPGSSGFS